MSEHQNTRLVASIFEAFGRGDIPFILDHLTDDVHFQARLDPIVPWSGEYTGKSDVVNFFQALGGAVEVGDHPVNQLVAQDDTVVAMGDVTFRVRETGTNATSAWIYVWKVRDGQIYDYEQFNDSALAAAFR